MKRRDETASAGFARLSARATAGAWRLEDAIDWSLPVAPARHWPRGLHVRLVSQLRHGEEATAAICRHLIDALEGDEARRCLAVQESDERRHAAAYGAYVRRLGQDAPANPLLDALFQRAAAWKGHPLAMVLAFHIVIEGEALKLQKALAASSPCPLFRAINARIANDEARHVAFGVRYARAALPDIDAEDRAVIAAWLKSLWFEAARITTCHFGALSWLAGIGHVSHDRMWRRRAERLARLGLNETMAA